MHQCLLWNLSRVLMNLSQLLGFSALYLVVLVLTVLAVPVFFVWRSMATFLIQLQHKKVRFLTGVDNWFTYGESNDESCILCIILCEGEPELGRMKLMLRDNFAERNPLLMHYIVQKYGYSFWRKERRFDIDDHVFWHPDANFSSQQELNRLARRTYLAPFKSGTSPWRFDIFAASPTFEGLTDRPFYGLGCTFHHALADGYSMLHTFLDAVGNKTPTLPEPKRSPVPVWDQFLTYLKSIPYIPWFLIQGFVLKTLNVYRPDSMSGLRLNGLAENFAVAAVKKVKTASNIPFSVVLLSCITAALKKHLARKRLPIPPKLYLSTSYSLRTFNKNKENLTNNFYMYPLEVPITRSGSAREQLLAIGKAVGSSTNVAWKVFLSLFVRQILLIVPNSVGKIAFRYITTTAYMGIGGNEDSKCCLFGNGSVISRVSIVICLNKPTGIAFCAFTQGENIHVSLNIDSNLATNDEVILILKDMENELKELEKSCS